MSSPNCEIVYPDSVTLVIPVFSFAEKNNSLTGCLNFKRADFFDSFGLYTNLDICNCDIMYSIGRVSKKFFSSSATK